MKSHNSRYFKTWEFFFIKDLVFQFKLRHIGSKPLSPSLSVETGMSMQTLLSELEL